MTITIKSGERSGAVAAPSSKSAMHRLLIAACLGQNPVTVLCDRLSDDTEATINCMKALGAEITIPSQGIIEITPIAKAPEGVCQLFCKESGSTLRFLLPLVGAIGASAVFHMEGRLSQRPLSPLWEELTAHGMSLKKEGDLLFCEGKLRSGEYSLPGNVSSQYISGLLMALPLLGGNSRLAVTGDVQSAAYITMTEDVLRMGGVDIGKSGYTYEIKGSQRASLPKVCPCEGDWSNGA